jgi:hypothetical protein
MRLRALAEQPRDDGNNVSTSYALAIEPDASQAEILERLLGERIEGTLKVVGSTDEAFAALDERVPDLILMSPLLAPQDEGQIVERLAALGVGASHVQLLTIPRVGDTPQMGKKRRFGWSSQKTSQGAIGCDPVAFANQVTEYLAHASALRQASRAAEGSPDPNHAPDVPDINDANDADALAGLRIEHLEQLLERFDAEPPPHIDGDPPPIPERDLMAMTTTHEPNTGTTRNPTEPRLPRFLTLDEQVPLPLRALLAEADGCLKMSFLTGAGACADRTLDLLLAEQGLSDADRGDQILQLGKKHPAVAESFLRGLSLVTNHPSGAWDEPRATLAIAILKAIAYEIYVLGPERKERAAYVIELLERYKSVAKG